MRRKKLKQRREDTEGRRFGSVTSVMKVTGLNTASCVIGSAGGSGRHWVHVAVTFMWFVYSDPHARCGGIARILMYSQTPVRELNSFLKVVRKPKLFSP
jgi:hypothetical protein